MTLVNPMRNL